MQDIKVLLADLTEHLVGPIKTWLLLIFSESNPEPIRFIVVEFLRMIKFTVGVALVEYWKLQLAEQFEGIPFTLTENYF